MNVRHTTIPIIEIALTAAEARAVLADPKSLLDKLSEFVGAVKSPEDAVQRKPPSAKRSGDRPIKRKGVRGPRAAKVQELKARVRAIGAPGAFEGRERKKIEKVPCPNCGVPIASYRVGRHKCKPVAAAE